MLKFDHIQIREIFHFLFLEELIRISDPALYVLKGGVNLRFFFRSPRYSEDMDLDVLTGNVSTLKKNGYKILESASFRRSLRMYGINDLEINDPTKAKQTETTQRFRLSLVTEAGERFPTKVEFSRRTREKDPFLLEKLNPDIAKPYQRLAFRCQHYSGHSAAIQKIRALAGRQITQARDVFDLSVLHSGGYLKREIIYKEIPKSILENASSNLQALHYAEFQGQVLEFLEKDSQKEHASKEIWEDLKHTVLKIIS